MSRLSIKGGEVVLAKLFSNDFVFAIPGYQRPYAWEEEEAEALVDDLTQAMDAGGHELKHIPPYFLGSIVLVKDENAPESEVVDGQQRLTTLTILLAALRANFQGKQAQNLARHIYEEEDLLAGTPNRYRLSLRDRDEAFFRTHVQDEGAVEKRLLLNVDKLSDSQRCITVNANLIHSKVASMSDERRFAFAQYLTQHCYVVVVSTPSLDSAFRIFSVLNDRGRDLSHADILKAEIVGSINERDRESYTKRWEDAEEKLGRENFKELFTHLRMIRRRVKLDGTVLAEIRKYVEPTKDPRAFVDSSLLPLAEAFDIIKSANFAGGHAAAINATLRWLDRVDHFDWIPPALELVRRFESRPTSLLDLLRKLERLAATLMVGRVGANERVRRYADVLQALEQDANLMASESPLTATPEEKGWARDTVAGNLYLANARVRSYVLLRLDSILSEGEATYDHGMVTVEHVLPQTPKHESNWNQTWTAAERENWVHRLGNLLLLSRRRNSQAQNFDFDDKKTKYFKTQSGISGFALTTDVLNHAEWTPSVVARRHEKLVQKVNALWEL